MRRQGLGCVRRQLRACVETPLTALAQLPPQSPVPPDVPVSRPLRDQVSEYVWILSVVLAQSRCSRGLACIWLWLTLASTPADPGWASISRGVLVCDECCSVHRSLGRHISIVKHLRHSAWPPTLLQVRCWSAVPPSPQCALIAAHFPHSPYTPPWIQ